ncbi:MAG: acetyltransferase [Helicobacteraceae bacterium]|nr:acetyltransferase [Helicobacteraceae bacterium]
MGNGDRLFVYGAGGHGRVVAESAARSGLRIEGFIDDSGQNGITRSEFLERAAKERFSVALAIGDNKTRRKIALELNKNSVEIATIIDPSAQVSCSAHIGKGAVILAGAVVNSQARIEEGAIVNSGAVVEHDCVIGAYAHVSPNAALAGGARAESLAHIGIGACLINNVSVGKESIVGAGAVVTKDILPFCTAVGAPARAIKSKIDEKPAQE